MQTLLIIASPFVGVFIFAGFVDYLIKRASRPPET